MTMRDRRTFLKDSIGSLVGISAAVVSPHVVAQSLSAKQRPFHMIVLGDSVMWGQGLHTDQKFYYLVYRWLESEIFNKARSITEPRPLAHSDAPIFPRFQSDRDFVESNNSNETRLPNPSILFQASTALSDCKKPGGSGPENIDLILVNGGINDFRAERFLAPILRNETIKEYARQYCGHGMGLLLRFLSIAFPNARIVVTGYYPLVSMETDPNFVRKAALRFLFGTSPTYLFNIPFFAENRRLRNELARRSSDWVKYSDQFLAEAVSNVNREFPIRKRAGDAGDRVIFVRAPFGPGNAYGAGKENGNEADRPYLWELNDRLLTNDPMKTLRGQSCDTDKVTGVLYEICKRAAAFHPNEAGATAYANAIKNALMKMIPTTNWILK